jgi:serine/threonine kinase 16
VQDPSGDGKIVYLFLPLYRVRPIIIPSLLHSNQTTSLVQRGNLQDAINANTINTSRFSEKEMVTLFKGTCEAIRAMHDYQAIVPINSTSGPSTNTNSAAPSPTRMNHSANSSTSTIRPNGNANGNDGYADGGNFSVGDDEDEPEDDSSFPEPYGDAEGGFSYGGSVPLVPTKRPKQHGKNINKGKGRPARVYDGDEELEQLNAQGPDSASAVDHDAGVGASGATAPLPAGMKREHVPYAHRDIKPANVMLADDGHPVLMDFGSTVLARTHIRTRGEALTQQVCLPFTAYLLIDANHAA